MPKIKDENYYVIHGWMLNQLNLKGVQLQIYAIVYGFSQCQDVEFSGSLSYLCDFTGASKPTVIKAINDLQEKGLIVKREEKINGVQFNRYAAILPPVKKLDPGSKETLPGLSRNFTGGSKETLMGLSRNFTGGSKETLPNNIYIKNNIKNSIKKDKEKRKRKATEVALTPTIEELEQRFSHDLACAVLDWLTYKTQRGDSYTPIGLEALLTRIKNNADEHGDQSVINLIQLCIENNWKGIIWDKLRKQDSYNAPQQPSSLSQSGSGNVFVTMLRKSEEEGVDPF